MHNPVYVRMIRVMIGSLLWTYLGLATLGGVALCALGGCGDKAPRDDATLKVVEVFGEPGTQRGQFVYPRGMDVFEFEGQPCAVIVDKTARIQMLDLQTGRVMGSIHTPTWDRGKPTGLTVGVSALHPGKLAVYVADTHEHRVLMYELPLPDVLVPVPTEPDFAFGSFGEDPGQFIYPTDVAIEVGDDGQVEYLYVSEYGGNDRISRFRVVQKDLVSLEYEYQIGIVGEEVDASDYPNALARPQSIELWTNPQGNRELIVTDASHHRVGRFTVAGDLVKWFGNPLDVSSGAMRFPYGLTVLDDGTAIITEFGGNCIRCIDLESGETLWRYGVGGRKVGQVAQPWASGVMGDQLVILDSDNSRVQICTLPNGVSDIGNEYTQSSTRSEHAIGSNHP